MHTQIAVPFEGRLEDVLRILSLLTWSTKSGTVGGHVVVTVSFVPVIQYRHHSSGAGRAGAPRFPRLEPQRLRRCVRVLEVASSVNREGAC